MNVSRVFPVFTVAYALVYALAVQYNWPLFSYFPILGQFRPGLVAAAKDTGPAMYWYGWMATSAIAGVAVSIVALIAPRIAEKLPSALTWLVPLVAIAWTTWVTAKIWFF
jgi:hypothetical protein